MAGEDIARLALLRALWLQKDARRCLHRGNREAAIVQARCAIETGVAGIYCEVVPEAADKYEAATGHSIKTLIVDLVDELLTPQEFGDLLREEFGKGREPNLSEMVEQILAHGGPPEVGPLSVRYYAPLSNLYIHASPTALLRHVHPRTQRLRRRPTRLWSARSAVNMADTVVGLLGRTLSDPGSEDWRRFDDYLAVHGPRSLPVQTYFTVRLVSAKLLGSSVRPIVQIVRRARRLATGDDVESAELDDLYTEILHYFDIGERGLPREEGTSELACP